MVVEERTGRIWSRSRRAGSGELTSLISPLTRGFLQLVFPCPATTAAEHGVLPTTRFIRVMANSYVSSTFPQSCKPCIVQLRPSAWNLKLHRPGRVAKPRISERSRRAGTRSGQCEEKRRSIISNSSTCPSFSATASIALAHKSAFWS